MKDGFVAFVVGIFWMILFGMLSVCFFTAVGKELYWVSLLCLFGMFVTGLINGFIWGEAHD